MNISTHFHRRRKLTLAIAFLVGLMVMLSALAAISGADSPDGVLAPAGVSTLGDLVWEDVNLDGVKDLTEVGINDVTITLRQDLDDPGTSYDGVFDPVDDPEYIENGSSPNQTTRDDGTPEPGWYDYSITADGNAFWVVIDDSNFESGGALENYVLTTYYDDGNASTFIEGEPGDNLRMWVYAQDIVMDINFADFGFASTSIEIQKTVYDGWDSGVSCQGGELVNGEDGDKVTYCFEVTNVGDTYLDTITITDTTLSIDRTDMTALPSQSDTEPLAPTESIAFYYETTITKNLTNEAETSGTPQDDSGNDLLGPGPTDKDTAEVAMYAPSIVIEKTVYGGTHNLGGSCPDVINGIDELVNGVENDPVTYCFKVTNVGDTYLDTIVISDTALSIPATNNVTKKSGSIPLAPNNSVAVYYYETTITADLLNTATATGNPTNSAGVDLPGLDDPVSPQDTAEVAMYAPSMTIEKTVYGGTHNLGDSCPDVINGIDELVNGVENDPVTYCFKVTNTGDIALNTIVISDTALSIPATNSVTKVSGSLPLQPGNSAVYYYETTITADLLNTATATGTPPLDEIPPPTTPPDTTVVEEINPALTISKGVVTASPVRPGETVAFTITLKNTGDTPITTLPLTDTYQSEYLSYVSTSPDNDGVDTTTQSGVGTITWTDLTTSTCTDLDLNETCVVTINFLAVKDTGDLDNDVTVNVATVSGALANPGNNANDVTVPNQPLRDSDVIEIIQPTGLTLVTFDATVQSNSVTLSWETASEVNILGFSIMRRAGKGAFTPLSEDLIFAKNSGSSRGSAYEFVDDNLSPGVYEYALLVRQLNYYAELSLPVRVKVNVIGDLWIAKPPDFEGPIIPIMR